MHLLADIDTRPTVLEKLLNYCQVVRLSALKSLAVMQHKLLIGPACDFLVDIVHPGHLSGHVLHTSANSDTSFEMDSLLGPHLLGRGKPCLSTTTCPRLTVIYICQMKARILSDCDTNLSNDKYPEANELG